MTSLSTVADEPLDSSYEAEVAELRAMGPAAYYAREAADLFVPHPEERWTPEQVREHLDSFPSDVPCTIEQAIDAMASAGFRQHVDGSFGVQKRCHAELDKKHELREQQDEWFRRAVKEDGFTTDPKGRVSYSLAWYGMTRAYPAKALGVPEPTYDNYRVREVMLSAGFELAPDEGSFCAFPKFAEPAKQRRPSMRAAEMGESFYTPPSAPAAPSNVVQLLKTQQASAKWLTPAERAAKVGQKVTRLKTGFATLDAATRGGLSLRKVVAIGGAPGAGKTAVTVQMAYLWLLAGVHVAFLAADEDADAILVRFGQLAGLSRELLEDGNVAEREKLVAWCRSVPLMLVDGDEDGVTVETVSKALQAAANGKPTAMVVDSMQTVRTTEQPAKGSDIRARVNIVVRTLKHAAKVDGHLVVATSEISKAAYRNKAQSENISALSAFKESGDIEYGVGLALVLTSRQGTSELVDAVVAKNRLGHARPEMLLKLDHVRAGVTEASVLEFTAADPLYILKQEIIKFVASYKGGDVSKNAIAARIGGKRATLFKAIDELVESRILFQSKDGIRTPLPGDAGYVESST